MLANLSQNSNKVSPSVCKFETYDKKMTTIIQLHRTDMEETRPSVEPSKCLTWPGTLGHSLADKYLSSIALTAGSRFTTSQYPPRKPHLQITRVIKQRHSPGDNKCGKKTQS